MTYSYLVRPFLHLLWLWLHVVGENVTHKGPISVCSGASASIQYPDTCGGAALVNMKTFSSHHPGKSEAASPNPDDNLLEGEDDNTKTKWSYRETSEAYGPHNWWRIARTCKGPNQSPIDIITSNALEMGIESPLELAMDDPTGKSIIHGTLINNGKTIEFELNNSSPPVVFSGEITNGEGYLLKQLHLHFGCGMKTGSEHSIDGIRYSGEMHLVFKNMKYGHPEVAMRKKDGIVILAFFFQVRSDDGETEPNLAFEKISKNIVYVQFPKQRAPLRDGISLTELIPLLKHGLVNLKRYVYKGSLPTPPCYESVQWVVFHRPINILTNKLSGGVFNDDKPNALMCGNYRPKRQLNSRHVFKFTLPAATAFTTPTPNTALYRIVKTTQRNPLISLNTDYRVPMTDNDDNLPVTTSIAESYREVFGPDENVTESFRWKVDIDKPAPVVGRILSWPTTPTTPLPTTTPTTTEDPFEVLMSLINDLENDKDKKLRDSRPYDDGPMN